MAAALLPGGLHRAGSVFLTRGKVFLTSRKRRGLAAAEGRGGQVFLTRGKVFLASCCCLCAGSAHNEPYISRKRALLKGAFLQGTSKAHPYTGFSTVVKVPYPTCKEPC